MHSDMCLTCAHDSVSHGLVVMPQEQGLFRPCSKSAKVCRSQIKSLLSSGVSSPVYIPNKESKYYYSHTVSNIYSSSQLYFIVTNLHPKVFLPLLLMNDRLCGSSRDSETPCAASLSTMSHMAFSRAPLSIIQLPDGNRSRRTWFILLAKAIFSASVSQSASIR